MGLSCSNLDIVRLISTRAFEKLLDTELDLKKFGWKLRILYQDYKKAREPFIEERNKILEMHQKKDNDGALMVDDNGLPVFKSEKDRIKANRKLDELLNMEVKLEHDSVEMTYEDIPEKITLATLIDLEPFIKLPEE